MRVSVWWGWGWGLRARKGVWEGSEGCQEERFEFYLVRNGWPSKTEKRETRMHVSEDITSSPGVVERPASLSVKAQSPVWRREE